MKTVIILTGNRNTSECITLDKKTEKLSVYQKAVGGWIETLGGGTDWICYVNDEGLLKNLSTNLYAICLWNKINPFDKIIYGPAVFVFKNTTSTTFIKAKNWFDLYKNKQLTINGEDEDDEEEEED
jgi:hypothetical protein